MTPSASQLRAFVDRNTRLQPIEDLPGIRLHVGDDVMAICRSAGEELGIPDPDLPYWAFPWAGGLAVARYLFDHPQEVAGRRVLDIAAGSGICAITAARLGAASARAVDVDPLAEAAVALNARANAVRIPFTHARAADHGSDGIDVILAGDVCYQEGVAGEIVAWLRGAATQGIRVLIGDPGRTYLPPDLVRLATYRVRTSMELEPEDRTETRVYTFATLRADVR
jgi:predicted nicotinamide N-methyase